MKKKKIKKKSKSWKSKLRNTLWFIYTVRYFILVFAIISILLYKQISDSHPVTSVDERGLEFLNKYEYPQHMITADSCMVPYDVGDGVVTFGPGLTYKTANQGYKDLNKHLETNYDDENNCIDTADLLELQLIRLVAYEQTVINIAEKYNIDFTQDQFNALVLLAYNSPNLFKNQQFIDVITSPDSTRAEYIEAADGYYQKLSGYDTKFGSGWYNRIVDSAEMYYDGDYRYQN